MDSRFHRPNGWRHAAFSAWARLSVWRIRVLVHAVILGGLAVPGLAAEIAKLQQFHIDAGDAALTLNEFSRQSSLQLLFEYNIVRNRKTHAVSGEMAAPAALRLMLSDTGLVFDFVNDRTLAVTFVSSGNAIAAVPAPNRAPGGHPAETQDVRHEGPGTADPGIDAKAHELAVVHVTGTNLRGELPVGEHVISLDREALDNSGVPTVKDFLRTLPQTFGGGATEDTRLGTEAGTNSGLGSGINLRGLGARSTLVLINGRRMAPGGTEAQFVDIESIPMSAVERIDILPDSASALYGADAVGGVVNFEMRDNFRGAETLARGGSGTSNTLGEYQAAQTVGRKWDSGNALFCLEFYRRDALPAYTRRYATSNLVPLGGGNFNSPLSNPGNLIVNGQSYAIPSSQDGTHLSAANLVAGTQNLQDRYLGADLLPGQKRFSAYASTTQSLADHVSLFSNVLVSQRDAKVASGGFATSISIPSSNPFYVNPAGGTGPVKADYSFLDDLGPMTADTLTNTSNITLGLDIDAGESWRVNVYGNYARERQSQHQGGEVNFAALTAALADPDPATAFNPFGAGSHTNPATIKAISSVARFYTNSALKSAQFTMNGPLARLPGGQIKLAAGVDLRDQTYSTAFSTGTSTPLSQLDMSRRITATFGELTIPLFGKDNGGAGYRRLELSVATRYEDYSDFGHSTTPKMGLLWSPFGALAFRGTWGRSIRAPTLADLNEAHNAAQPFVLRDALSPTGTTAVLLWGSKNASLQEERAKSWTAGLDFKPDDRVPGLAVSLTYFNILFDGRIQSTVLSANILNDPSLADIVTRNPSATLIESVCNHSTFALGSTADCIRTPVGAIVDLRLHNLAMVSTRGIDFTTTWERTGNYGRLNLSLDGTWLLKFDQAQGPNSPVGELLSTQNNPIDLRMRGTLSWQLARFGATTGINFQNRYRDVVSQPNRPIRSFTTVDAQLRYDIAPYVNSWLQNTRLEINAINVFNVSPPFFNNQLAGLGYDQENADPDGRLLSLQIRKTW